MKINIKLKQCPFCGGEAEVIKTVRTDLLKDMYGVHCKSCHILIGNCKNYTTEFFWTSIEAMDAWNKRISENNVIIINAKVWNELSAVDKAKMMLALKGYTLRIK